MKINNFLFALLCSFLSLSAAQQGAGSGAQPGTGIGLSGLLAPVTTQNGVLNRHMIPATPTTAIDVEECRTITQTILAQPGNVGHETFSELSSALNDNRSRKVTGIRITDTSPKKTIIVDYSDSSATSVDLNPLDTNLFLNTQRAVNTSTTPSRQPSTSPNGTVINPTVNNAGQNPTSPTAISDNPAKQDDDSDDKNSTKDKDTDKRPPYPYGYPPYNHDDNKEGSSASTPSLAEQSSGGRGGKRNQSNQGGNLASGFDDPYHGMNPDYYGNSMSVNTGGGMYNDKSGGSVGNALSQQVGFAVTKPSMAQPKYATVAEVKKLSSNIESRTVVPKSATDEATTTPYQRTVEREAEPLYHSRLTEVTKRLHIAPVKEEPVKLTEEPLKADLKKVEKKPISFFGSLWNTVTQPLVTVMSWFLSFFYRK